MFVLSCYPSRQAKRTTGLLLISLEWPQFEEGGKIVNLVSVLARVAVHASLEGQETGGPKDPNMLWGGGGVLHAPLATTEGSCL